MLKLKLQNFSFLMQRTGSLEKTLMLGKIEGGRREDNRGWDGWMASPTQWTWVWVTLGVGDGQGGLACLSPCCGKESATTEWLNWTDKRSDCLRENKENYYRVYNVEVKWSNKDIWKIRYKCGQHEIHGSRFYTVSRNIQSYSYFGNQLITHLNH